MHVGGHLRDPFIEAIENNEFPSKEILGKLWNCTDIMPGHIRQEVGGMTHKAWTPPLPEPMTYAQGARRILEAMKRAERNL